MGEIEKIMAEYLPKYKIDITDKQLEQFKKYAEILEEWNKKINLTAITQKDQIAIKHFIDSLLILKSVDIAQGASIVDVGTGAGFPGVPLKIMRPDIKLTLIDSLNKRITFLTNHNYKLFKILSNTDILPSDEILLSIKKRAFEILKVQNYMYYEYNLDTNIESFK